MFYLTVKLFNHFCTIIDNNDFNGIIYEIPKIFIKKFNELYLKFKKYSNIYINEYNNLIGKINIIKRIIDEGSNREIGIKDYNLLKENLKELLYNRTYGEEIDYLHKMSNDFYVKKKVTTRNVIRFKILINENVKLRFGLGILENQKSKMENKSSYDNFMYIKKLLINAENQLLKRTIEDKQKELEELKIKKEGN